MSSKKIWSQHVDRGTEDCELLAHSNDVGRLVSREITKTPYKIALQNKEQSIGLQDLEIKNYCEIPLDKIAQKFFFVNHKIQKIWASLNQSNGLSDRP